MNTCCPCRPPERTAVAAPLPLAEMQPACLLGLSACGPKIGSSLDCLKEHRLSRKENCTESAVCSITITAKHPNIWTRRPSAGSKSEDRLLCFQRFDGLLFAPASKRFDCS